MKIRHLLFSFISILLISINSFGEAKERESKPKIKFDRVLVDKRTDETTFLSPFATYKNIQIKSESALLDNTKKTIVFSTRVTAAQTGSIVTCDKLTTDLNGNRSIATGSVVLTKQETIKGTKDTVKVNTTVIKADRLVSNTDTNNFIGTGNISLNQKDMTIKADEIRYTDKDERIVILGNVSMTKADDTQLNGEKLIYYSKGDTFEFVGKGTISLPLD